MTAGLASVNVVDSLLQSMRAKVVVVAERAREISADTQRQTAALGRASQGLAQLAALNEANTDMVVSTVHGCESLHVEAGILLERIAVMHAHRQPGTLTVAATTATPRPTAEPEYF